METTLPVPVEGAVPAEQTYQRRIRAWSLYDVADH